MPYTILRPIQNINVLNKTLKEQTIWYYNEIIILIMKAIGLNNITHCIDNQYWLITLQGEGNILIYIVLSIWLTKHLL